MYTVDIELEKKEILKRYRNLLKVCKPKSNRQDKLLIRKAFNLAVEAHKDMRRRSGEPYIYHPIEVATIAVGEIGLGTTSVICALLHDVVEDTDYTLSDIESMFGEKVSRIIDGLTKIEGFLDQKPLSEQAENFKKMLLTLTDDVRVILIKLADRLHNMRTIEHMPREKQLKIASETLYLYVPLAHRLGLYVIKSELEDLSLKVNQPEVFLSIEEKLKKTESQRKRFIEQFKLPIKQSLTKEGFTFEITYRTKSIASIWRKMNSKKIPFEDVFDIFALRIIIDSLPENENRDCWTVYAIVTELYTPNTDRLRDWVSTPKSNGYKSLHTTVMSDEGKWVEVQIRSKRMDEIAEKGYAAHWKYKGETDDGGLDMWLAKIRELLNSEESNAMDFVKGIKNSLYAKEIIVFTPKGKEFVLPDESCIIDFGYAIHSDIGNHCIGAKVNNKLVPINQVLKSGDQVEIITSKKQFPQQAWLNYVKTSRAVSRINLALKDQKKEIVDDGKKIFMEYLIELNLKNTPENIKHVLATFKLQNANDLYYFIGIKSIGLIELKECFSELNKSSWFFLPSFFKKSQKQKVKEVIEKISLQLKNDPASLLLNENIDEIKYTIAPCCNPIPGDAVIAIELTQGIEIHTTTCTKAIEFMSNYGKKIVKAKWNNQEMVSFLAGLKINGFDKKGIIKDISRIISEDLSINIRSFNIESSEGIFEGNIMVYIQDTQHLQKLISNLKKVNGVDSVRRV